MFQVRVHGRGGQGVVTTAELLSTAAFADGHHAQAFPSFGSERTGAPVVAFCRLDDRPIRLREPVGEPDAVIVADATLLHQVDVFNGLRPGGFVLVNSEQEWSDLGLAELAARLGRRAQLVAATPLALAHVGRPVPNAPLLGGFAALTKTISLSSVHRAIREKFPARIADGNVRAASAAYEYVGSDVRTFTDA